MKKTIITILIVLISLTVSGQMSNINDIMAKNHDKSYTVDKDYYEEYNKLIFKDEKSTISYVYHKETLIVWAIIVEISVMDVKEFISNLTDDWVYLNEDRAYSEDLNLFLSIEGIGGMAELVFTSLSPVNE